jgi:hypothetical protein
VITAYALAAGLRRLPTATGIGGASVEILRHRSLAVLVTRHEAPPSRSRDAVLAHAGVCEDLMTKADAVLPVRFGEAFDDEAALMASLDDRHDRLAGVLERVRDRVEIGVRVRWDESTSSTDTMPASGNGAGAGRAYLMARVEDERRRRAVEERADAVAGLLHAALRTHAADSRLEVLPTEGQLMSGVYLVDRDHVDGIVEEARRLGQDHPDLDVLCTGPWAPYSFADGEEPDAR